MVDIEHIETFGINHSFRNKTGKLIRRIFPSPFGARPMIEYVKKNLKGKLVGAEIGMYKGENSRNILKTLDMKMLYGIDPIKQHNLKQNNFVYLEKYSQEAVDYVSDNLDFVYIDGSHSYKNVKLDIELYYPKVKKGGIVGGHDFCSMLPGVPRAVLEFVDREKLKLLGLNFDWWVVKK